jgi:hypothetical protein
MQPLHLLRRGRAACHHADGRRALSAFNTSHSGVGYYAPVARTTLNPFVFLSSSRSLQRSSKTPKPLLILGFRAGALRHPAGDLLSDIGPKAASVHSFRVIERELGLHLFPN